MAADPKDIRASGQTAGSRAVRSGMRGLRHDIRRAYVRFQEHEGFRSAASISFYVLLSAVPAVALLIASIGWMTRDAHDQTHLLEHMLDILPLGSVQNRSFLNETVRVIRESGGRLTVLGALGLAWGALGMFSAIRWGLNRAFSASRRSGFVRVTLVDLGAAMTVGLLLLIAAMGTTALHLLTGESEGWAAGAIGGLSALWGAAEWAIPALFTFAAFVFLYRYVPNVPHTYRDVIPAAVMGTLLFELSKYLFGIYMDYVTSTQVIYSALGGTFGFIMWVYVSSVTLLFGAELSWSYGHRRSEARERRMEAGREERGRSGARGRREERAKP